MTCRVYTAVLRWLIVVMAAVILWSGFAGLDTRPPTDPIIRVRQSQWLKVNHRLRLTEDRIAALEAHHDAKAVTINGKTYPPLREGRK